MAIISIPTSIGGINIPGGIFDGPLSDLDKVGGIFMYKYPRDLESATKSHSVNFRIYEIKEVTLEELNNIVQQQAASVMDAVSKADTATLKKAVTGGVDVLEDKLGALTTKWDETTGLQFAKDTVTSVMNFGTDALVTGVGFIDKNSGFLKQPAGEYVGHISLYMPEAFNLSSAIAYDDSTSVASALGTLPLLGNMIKSATNFIGDGTGGPQTAVQVALNRAGYVFNPQKQVLFQGVEFRQFSMSFTFTPYSQAEAEQIKQIIQKFRMYAAPKRNESLNKNMFWVPPALFEIDFRMNGTHNKHLPKLQKCVINNIDVNYAPNGWTTHTDGAPVQTILTLEFQETSLIGRDEIMEGY